MSARKNDSEKNRKQAQLNTNHPNLAHLFPSKLWGNVSGLFAGGQLFLAWLLQWTRCHPQLIEACWEFYVDTFASFEKRVGEIETRRFIRYVAVAWNSSEP